MAESSGPLAQRGTTGWDEKLLHWRFSTRFLAPHWRLGMGLGVARLGDGKKIGRPGGGHIWSGSMILPPFCLHACSVIRTKPLPLHVFIPWQPWLKLLQRL